MQNVSNEKLYALKKIKCSFGNKGIKKAMKEADYHRKFKSNYLLKSYTHQLVKEADGSEFVYILFPYFAKGSVAQVIRNCDIEGSYISEKRILVWCSCLCKALQYLHENVAGDSPKQPEVNDLIMFDEPQVPQNTSNNNLVSYIHGDIKPDNLLLHENSREIVLTDFGSICLVPIFASNNSEAIAIQDKASENCTMPFRAPELFHVKAGSTITEKADIWSFGCTLYTIMFHASPFEREVSQGGSLALAVCNAQYSFPRKHPYSTLLCEIVEACLQREPNKRPSARELLSKIDLQINQ